MAVGRIARNALFLLSGQIVSKVIAFGYVILFARLLGPRNFGVYSFVIAYLALFTTIADLGLNRLVMRDVSRNPSQLGLYFWNILALRFVLAGGALVVFVGSLAFLGTDRNTLMLGAIAGLTLFPSAVSTTLDGIAVARQQMNLIAVSQALLALLTAVLGGIAVLTEGGLGNLFVALVLASVLHASSLFLYWWNKGLLGKPFAQRGFWREAFLRAWPYALLSFLGVVYFRIDTVMLNFMKGPEITGQYAAAYRILEASIFIPAALTTAVFPVFAQLHVQRREELWRLYARTMKVLAIVAIPLMGTLVVLAPEVVRLFYGVAYEKAASALRVLSLAIFFVFIHSPTGALLLSAENLNLTMALSFLTAGLNIGLNLLLIPPYSILGASVATVLSEAVSFVIFLLVAQHIVRATFPFREAFRTPLLATVAAAVVAVSLWSFHPLASVAGGLIVYSALIVRLEWSLLSGGSPIWKRP
ncbi:MAG TPA: flippase [Methylomirabilota bacterium]|nr:flippase [Methylomirabilota bacterium]